ncbi:hypothetical protein M409DRAFT_19757 [Zasmidium cellare ATCC 36951]|uniref:FAD-binding domain-containing protein n=1 Tax=Zasmidium cellare ATCC 36951 TaxID=1080233 RepID=A0A6A6CST2_ZASCE|nr:uncharacterized protein M409DRAFT_19757 [Zasmidium cellare ATCC 36951]KAF2170151.1 hypothetical protein M409DRAFT_19757 [Zasmidium cellare ATCC 36951]
MAANKEFKVLIIGGGNCGLLIATGLKKHGINYTVFERDNEYDFVHKPRDWGMLLHWGTEYLYKPLPTHLQARFKEPRVDPSVEVFDPIPYFHGASGEILKRVTTKEINRVSRKKLRKFLSEGEDLNLEFNKRVQGVEVKDDIVKVTFEDGTTATGNMLIGADGSNSKVREFLVGHDAAQEEEIGLTTINFPWGGYTDEQARFLTSHHPIVQLSFAENMGSALLAVLDTPDSKDSKEWKFQHYTSWWGPPYAKDLEDPAVRTKFFKERMARWCEPFRTAGVAVSDDAVIPIFPGRQWAPTMEWDNSGGKVTLAGDAAHSMLPHRGQGLNNAVKDASDLVDAIQAAATGSKSLSEAVTAYEAEMKPRGAKEVALSLEQAKSSRNVETWKESAMARVGHSRV